MNALTEHARAVQADLSARYGISQDAVRALMDAVAMGGGTQAQFSIPELGGMGQWSQGGMTMVGDMFNTGLQSLVSNLCHEIANAYFNGPFYAAPMAQPAGSYQSQSQGGFGMQMQMPGMMWWPEGLGQPSSSGSQNDMSYAIFPGLRRLAMKMGSQVTVYDTGEHQIGGVSQQQSGGADWTFTSQFGTVRLSDLPVISGVSFVDRSGSGPSLSVGADFAVSPPQPEPQPQPEPLRAPQPAPGGDSAAIFAALEKLGSLRDMGILSEEEFAAKKAELLARL